MNVYVFDSNALMHLFDYYLNQFTTLWKCFYKYVDNGQIVSVREVRNEINGHYNKERRVNIWAKQFYYFYNSYNGRNAFCTRNIQIEHFQVVISRKNL